MTTQATEHAEATVPPYEPVCFRGRYYLRGPLSALDWVAVQRLLWRLKDAEARGEFSAALVEAAVFIRRHLPPVSRWERWSAACRSNPFRRASVTEVGVLLGLILRGAQVASRFNTERAREVRRG